MRITAICQRTAIRLRSAVLPLFFFSFRVFSQGAPDPSVTDPQLLLSVDVGYNTAFRDRSWVPVDVTVVNETTGIKGWVEVQTYDFGGQRQSPVYRVRADCPEDSRKQFRLTCFLDGTERVEAWLYTGRGPAVDVPAYVRLTPIDKGDLLSIILDNDAIHFGFLYASVQHGPADLRLHRQLLATPQLGLLPAHQQCYKEFSGIVFADVDPAYVSEHHRALIEQYVRGGGSLVVCTGSHATRYRDSWLTPLMGVHVGDTELMTEAELASEVFLLPDREGIEPDRQLEFAALTPAVEGIERLGGERVLAARRPLGRGYVYTLAVDAKSGALQGCLGYQRLWYDMIGRARRAPELNTAAVTALAANQLPNISGVTIRPVSFVIAYLAVYILVGVLGNWLFWNAFKRREYAWLTLVPISIGFSLFAMYFGTAGWAKAATKHSIQVLRAPAGGGDAEYHALTGVLSPRTRRYSGSLDGANFLARDSAARQVQFNNFGNNRFGTNLQPAPFRMIEDGSPAIEGLRVGASELRMLQIDGAVSLPGGITGTLELSADGLRGQLQNGTGIELDDTALVLDGAIIPIRPDGGSWNIDVSPDKLNGRKLDNRWGGRNADFGNFLNEFMSRRVEDPYFDDVLRTALFMPGDDNAGLMPDPDHPPYLIGWAKEYPPLGFTPVEVTARSFLRTLVVADVDLRRIGPALERPFPLRMQLSAERNQNRDRPAYSINFVAPQQQDLLVSVTLAMSDDPESVLEIELEWAVEGGKDVELFLAPNATVDDAWREHGLTSREQATHNGQPGFRTVYRVPNWRDHRDADDPEQIRLRLFGIANGADPATAKDPTTAVSARIQDMLFVDCTVIATARVHVGGGERNEGWKPWQ